MTTQTERVSDERLQPALASLLERVRSAKGPDRVLDATIATDVAGLCLHGSWHSEGPDGDRGRCCDDCGADSWGNRGKFGQRLNEPVAGYTASIDAALALVGRLLPGWHVEIYGASSPTAAVKVEPLLRKDGEAAWSPNDLTPPLAILAALLSVLTKEPTSV